MQDLFKSLRPVFKNADCDQSVRDVRATDWSTIGSKFEDRIPRNRVVFREVFNHPLGASFARISGFLEAIKQSGVRGVWQICQQVHRDSRGRA